MIFKLNRKYFFIILFCFYATVVAGHSISIKIQNPKDKDIVSGTVDIAAYFYPNKCDKNRSYKEIDDFFIKTNTGFDKDLIRAIAWQESGWCQFDPNGNVYACVNNPGTEKESSDCGLMQINNRNSTLEPFQNCE
jgi:hypothetical protein